MPGQNGISLSDEKTNSVYTLSGETSGVKAGDRMTLQGKKNSKANHTFGWEVTKIRSDHGVCQP